MNSGDDPAVGNQIRALREERGLSLRALAELSGLSLNAISRIERGENSPTVSSLHQLARALKVPIVDLFERMTTQRAIFLPPDKRFWSETNGIRLESFGSGLTNQQMEPFVVTLAPNTGTLEEPVSHPGEECVYCLRGRVDYCVGSERYHLYPGCSLLIDASQPHAFCNVTGEPAQMILVFQSKGDGDGAIQRHLDPGTNRP